MKAVVHSLARFATEKGKVTNSRVHPKLFEPNKQFVLSGFRVENLKSSEIEKIGVEVVRQIPGSNHLYGWGELPSSAVDEVGLKLVNDDNPPLHSNIAGWPTEKSEQKLLSMQLALRAKPVKLARPIEVHS